MISLLAFLQQPNTAIIRSVLRASEFPRRPQGGFCFAFFPSAWPSICFLPLMNEAASLMNQMSSTPTGFCRAFLLSAFARCLQSAVAVKRSQGRRVEVREAQQICWGDFFPPFSFFFSLLLFHKRIVLGRL